MTIFRCSHFAAFPAAFFLFACDAPAENRESMLVEEAQQAVTDRLKDPDSANFRDVGVNDQNIVCGEMNARNGFGGYTGYSAFWYDAKSKEAFIYDPNQDWRGKGYDARLFQMKGCSIGGEQVRALEAAKIVDDSNKILGLEPFGPKEESK